MEHSRRILIVDDDGDVRASLARALQETGKYSVETAPDAFTAGVRFGTRPPDLLILDVVMPGMGGFDVCQRVRALEGGSRVKIVVLTGYPGTGASERSLLSGADLFLTKPQPMESFLAHIEDLLDD
ncbi:MAG: response regulator [Acidobacteriota bacterium]